jgi:hypothetical protein
MSMKTLCCIVATTTLLISAPAMAQQFNFNTNIWSSAQGTSNSYGAASGFSNSSSGSMANAGLPIAGATSNLTQAITTSSAGASSNGSGYAQTQTSGYAGGSISSYRSH